MPTEEEGQQARAEAEHSLRETQNRWPDVHNVSARLERVRNGSVPDPFIEDLRRAMKPRRPGHQREA